LPARWGTFALGLGLALVTLNNLSAVVPFVIEQRASNFLAEYKHGKCIADLRMADLMLSRVQRDGRVLAPSATILSYITGLSVYGEREVLGHLGPIHYPQALSNAGIRYAVLPARAYRDKDMTSAHLIARGLIVPERNLGRLNNGNWLARVRVIVPTGDWRELPRKESSQRQRARRATTTMLSPTASGASGAVASDVEKSSPAARIFATTSDITASVFVSAGPRSRSLKYSATAARISPIFRST
jgi:hypothetical protein